jgi:hypothetical protein
MVYATFACSRNVMSASCGAAELLCACHMKATSSDMPSTECVVLTAMQKKQALGAHGLPASMAAVGTLPVRARNATPSASRWLADGHGLLCGVLVLTVQHQAVSVTCWARPSALLGCAIAAAMPHLGSSLRDTSMFTGAYCVHSTVQMAGLLLSVKNNVRPALSSDHHHTVHGQVVTIHVSGCWVSSRQQKLTDWSLAFADLTTRVMLAMITTCSGQVV